METDDGTDTNAVDPFVPNSGGIAHYLIRARGYCGGDHLGLTSGGVLRTGRSCP